MKCLKLKNANRLTTRQKLDYLDKAATMMKAMDFTYKDKKDIKERGCTLSDEDMEMLLYMMFLIYKQVVKFKIHNLIKHLNDMLEVYPPRSAEISAARCELNNISRLLFYEGHSITENIDSDEYDEIIDAMRKEILTYE